MTGPGGALVTGIAPGQDVFRAFGRDLRLQQIRSLVPFGTCQYTPQSGWIFDDELLQLWGLDSAVDPLTVINELVLPQDQATTTAAWARVLARRSNPPAISDSSRQIR